MASVINKIKVGSTNYNIASTAYATCATAAATVAKVAYIEGAEATSGFTLLTGTTIHVKFTNSNTAAKPTLNVNGTGAKAIMKYGTTAVGNTVYTSWQAGSIVSLTYDGTNWLLNDHKNENSAAGDITGVTAGDGLTGGASSGAATLNVGAGDGITVTADAVAAKAGSGITVNSDGINVNTGYTTSGKNYKVQVDSTSGGLYVNVPWTDTDTNTHNSHKINSGKKSDNSTDILSAEASSGNITLGDSGVTAGTYRSVTVNSKGIVVAGSSTDADTHYTKYLQIKGNGTEAVKFTQDADKSLNLKPGTNVSISAASGEITISATDTNTTYSAGTGLQLSGTTFSAKLNNTTSLGTIGTTSKLYAVGVDANGKLCVNVPWTDTNTDTNTASAADNILDGSNSGTTITYAPYASGTATSTWVGTDANAGKLYLGTENPSKTTRLNYNGYLYGTKLYSGGKEVLTSHQDISGKQDKLTAQTAYTSKGSATKVPQITTNSLGQVTGITEVTITQPTVNNAKLTLNVGGAAVSGNDAFTANDSTDTTYNVPVATSSVFGVVKTSTGITNSSGTISVAYGTTAGTACQGNDSRLSDSRTPKSHTHGNIANDGTLSGAKMVVVTDGDYKITTSSISITELDYLAGVTSKIQDQLNSKVDENAAITGATKCKITYDSKGLVTAGANLAASDIPSLDASKITAMTGYSKASSASAVAASDSLNTAIGKLEKTLDGKLPISGGTITGAVTVNTSTGIPLQVKPSEAANVAIFGLGNGDDGFYFTTNSITHARAAGAVSNTLNFPTTGTAIYTLPSRTGTILVKNSSDYPVLTGRVSGTTLQIDELRVE